MSDPVPYAPQPSLPSSRPPWPTPSSSYITYSKLEMDCVDDKNTSLSERGGGRAGSPTPSEKTELRAFDGTIKRFFRKESWKDRRFLLTVFGIVMLIAITVVISIFQDDALKPLVPTAKWIHKTPAGWLIPIGMIILLSIPPLLGAEIVHILVGFAYGLWIGFLLTCVGTVIGECITFFMFRSCLRARAEKLEKSGDGGSRRLGALARTIREGGLWVMLVVKYSAFPTHITSALFATCGVTFFMFLVTLVLSLPRHLAGVYMGVLSREAAKKHPSNEDNIISNVVLGITILLTIVAMISINKRLKMTALTMIRERRARESTTHGLDINPFDSTVPYDIEHAYSSDTSVQADARDQPQSSSITNRPGGLPMPTKPAPAQIHLESSIV